MTTATQDKPKAVRQRIEGALHRSLPADLTIRAPADNQADDGLLRLQLSASSETPYLRTSWWDDPWLEVLGHRDGEVDLSRLNGGAVVLANHDRRTAVGDTPLAAIGAVERAWLQNGRLMADLIISRRDALADLRQDIADGLVRNVSIGYQINERTLTRAASSKGEPDEYRVNDWTPFEISLVDIPADATFGLGRQHEQDRPQYRVVDLDPAGAAGNQPHQERAMADENVIETPAPASQPAAATRTTDGVALERERVREVTALGRAHGMTDLADQAVESGMTLDNFRAQVLDKLKESGKLRAAEKPDIGMSEKEIERFSFCRALLAAHDPAQAAKLAPFELECSRAAQDKRGDSRSKERETAITVPVDVLSRGLQVNEAMAMHVTRQLIERAKRMGGAGMEAYRDLVVGTATAGGNLVATELLGSSFIEMLRNAMVLDQMGVTILRDLNGNVAIPSQTGAATAYWLAESGAPTVSQQVFGQVTLTPHTVGAYTDYSRRLLLQSSLDVEMFVRTDLAKVIGLKIQDGALNGTGASNQPTGLLNISGVGAVLGGTNGAAPTYENMVDLETAIFNANASADGTLSFLTNSKVRGKLRKTLESATAGAKWVWNSGRQSGMGDVLAYDAFVTNAMPSDLDKGTSIGVCSAMAFGDWAEMIIGMWGGLDLMLDPYVAATSGGRRVIALQDVDVNVRHVADFAVFKDILTA